MELPKKYDAKESEKKWIEYWEKNKIYSFDPNNTEKKIYAIDTPPPTISGRMHMGHAFGNSQQDFIARYKRMKGFNVLQPFGTDDNGLPTQLFIEKIKKVRARELGRDKFVELCLETLEKESRKEFLQDWKNLGISCDFDVSYTTINEHCRRVSQKSFIELYNMDRAYRKEAPAMWCPKCSTAVSQVELEDDEQESTFNDIVFKVDDNDLIIATTRPELLPACVAVFFHPDDARYKELEGKEASVPLFNFTVPILKDERVDKDKGTGIVMCCTFGDQTDIEWQKQYDLPIKTAISSIGKMTDIAGKYKDLKVKEARKQIIEDMKENELLVKQKPIKHFVNVHERCGHEIEFVHSKQWFIKYLDLKEDMLKWGEELKWHPKHMKNRYDNWVKGLSWDWCISRQIYFGIPFPVWYCKRCGKEVIANVDDLPVDPLKDKPPIDKCECGSEEFIGEQDIINTWATSSLSPTIVKELFKGKPVYDKLVKRSFDLRPQGHDIISFWLFNTVVKSRLHFEMNPWTDCFINGWILDPKGKKMSKSKGNVIAPQGIIEKYSADSLRYMSSGCKLGDDLAFPEKELVAGTRFINKLWNASKFSIMLLDKNNFEEREIPKESMDVIDRWILSKLNKVIKVSTDYFEEFRFFKAKKEIEDFFWKDFCDFYLEIVKDRIYNPDQYKKEEVYSGLYALNKTILSLLKMFAPFTPFITEEIYHLYFAGKENKSSIHKSSWPTYDENMIDDNVEEVGEFVVKVLGEVRKKKSENNLALNAEVKKIEIGGQISEDAFESIKKDLVASTKTLHIQYTKEDELEEEFEMGIEF